MRLPRITHRTRLGVIEGTDLAVFKMADGSRALVQMDDRCGVHTMRRPALGERVIVRGRHVVSLNFCTRCIPDFTVEKPATPGDGEGGA